MLPEPSILDMIKAASDAVKGQADKASDWVRGSDYESLAGPCAILWTRQARRDTDLFRAIRFNDAEGQDLTDLVQNRFGIARILDTRGSGTAQLTRPTTAGGGGTIWKGTRISLFGGGGGTTQTMYRVTADTPVSATATIASVPIEAVLVGPGSKAAETSNLNLGLIDPLWDSSWFASALTCTDGTNFESAAAFRARVRQLRTNARVGQASAIIQTCQNVGASNVALFPSYYGGDSLDAGLNVCYVGDRGFSGSQSLVRACQVALWSTRVGGDQMQVLPMAPSVVNVTATVTLRDSPTLFDRSRLTQILSAALSQYMNGQSGRWTYSIAGMTGACALRSQEVQNVSFATPSVDATIMSGGNFPQVLNRYILGTVSLAYQGP